MGLLGRLFGRRRLERQLDAELRDHLERQVADYLHAGLREPEARRRAWLDLGGLEQVKEACRDARGTRLLDDLGQDLRYGLRVLRKSPGFTVVAVLSLALGIGANTAIFTLVDSLILRALPVREPDRLVRLENGSWTNAIWEAIRDREGDFSERAAAFCETRFDLAAGGESDFVEGLFVSGGFFEVVGAPVVLGRSLDRADDRRDGGEGGPVAVISYAFWQRRFGGAADAVGRSIPLNSVPFTIVGVTAPSFFGPSVGRSFDVAAPIGLVDRVNFRTGRARQWLDDRSTWWLEILGRLGPSQTVESATQALRAAQPQIREATLPDGWPSEEIEKYLREEPFTLVPAENGFSSLRGQYERPLLTVMGVVVLVLLIACANIGALLLARASARRHELGARLALGASRARLARQLLTETLLLALPGALLGLAFAQWGTRLLVGQLASQGTAPVPVSLDLSLHWRVLLFTLLVTILTALLFGTAPAFRASGLTPQDALKQQGRGLAGERRRALGAPLVVAQVALSMVLVFAAGLFLRTFANLANRDLGLNAEGILLVNVDSSRSSTPPPERGAAYARALEAIASHPAVASVALSAMNPLSGQGWNDRFEVKGAPRLGGRESTAWLNAVSPRFFATYGTPLVAGRDIDAGDRAGSPPVVVVNEAFAKRFLAGQNPVGQVVLREGGPDHRPAPAEIVGVVKDTAYRSARDTMDPIVYCPIAQLGEGELWPRATVAVRSRAGSPSLLTRDVASAINTTDPRLSLSFRLFSDQVGATMRRERIVAGLSSFFGGLALLLAGIGLHGVTAFAVSQRRTEIGVRMALGARASSVLRMVLTKALGLVAIGLAIGAVLSLWSARFVTSLLFGSEGQNLPTLLASAATLVAVCLLSAALPARRASRIDPAQVLREG